MKPSQSAKGIEFLIQVEFSNNGALDTLTGTPAPKVFFDNLAREISKSKRKFQPISIVTVQVLSDSNLVAANKVLQDKNKVNQSGSTYEKKLISIGGVIKSSVRGGDFYSRIADDGFWICLQGDLVDAQKAADRFGVKISEAKEKENKKHKKISGDPKPGVIFTISEWDRKSTEFEWIHEIDLLYFGNRMDS